MVNRVKFAMLVLLAVVVGTQPVSAQQQAVLTDVQIDSIRQDCQMSKVALNRVHANDVVIRVNLGQRYETIARQLMAPLNSRIAKNSLDNVALTKTTVDFNRAYLDFTEAYRSYDISVKDALAIDCRVQPVEYYREIETSRDKRLEVAETIERLQKLAKQYGQQVREFGETIVGEQQS
jgi:hypothetical protein